MRIEEPAWDTVPGAQAGGTVTGITGVPWGAAVVDTGSGVVGAGVAGLLVVTVRMDAGGFDGPFSPVQPAARTVPATRSTRTITVKQDRMNAPPSGSSSLLH
jgi:hypothetical protein